MTSKPVHNALESVLEIIRKGDFNGAHIALERILQNDLENGDVLYCLSGVCFWEELIYQSQVGNTDFEIADYLISKWKDFLLHMEKQGLYSEPVIYAIKCGVFLVALEHYRKVYADESIYRTAELYRKIGLCCKILGDYESALKFFKQASALDKDSAVIYADLADTYAFCGELRMAKVFFREAFFRDAMKIEIHFLESELICRLIELVKKAGYTGDELLEWIPVFGVLKNVFNVKRELKALEIGKLKQRVFGLENEISQADCADKKLLVPRLINSYFWLIDHYGCGNSGERTKIEEILLKLKFLDIKVYNEYVG